MTIDEITKLIMLSEITIEQIPEARALLENEIEDCIATIQDNETQWNVHIEYKQKLLNYRKLLNRL